MDSCQACGDPVCPGRVAVDFCPHWQAATTRNARGEYLPTRPLTPSADDYCDCCEALGGDPHAGLEGGYCRGCGHWHGGPWPGPLTPSADLPACRDEDPAQPAALAAAYPDPPEYQHPEEPQDA